MKKQVKKNLIAALSLAFVASFGVAGLVKSNVNAGAVDAVAVEGNFQMDDGAAIRIKSNTPSGIRWSVTVTESYYNYVTSLGEVEWGMVVDNEPITEMGASDTQVNIPLVNQALPAFDANDGVEDTWTYYASITYDKLVADMEEAGYTDDQIETKLTQAYETVLYARAYNVVNGTTELAVDADTGRSIKGVAMNCLIQEATTGNDDVTDANKDDFIAYAGGDYTVAETQTFKNASGYATESKTGVVKAEVADGDYAAYFGAKYLGDVTATDGKVTVNMAGLAASQITLRQLSNINLVKGSEVTQVPFIVATHTISTEEEFHAYLNSYSGTGNNESVDDYAVVIADITCTGATPDKSGNSHRYFGYFDGLGHTISGIGFNAGFRRSLFGSLQSCTITNVAFTDMQLRGNNNSSSSLFDYIYPGTNVNNVYIQGTLPSLGMVNTFSGGSFNNIIVNGKAWSTGTMTATNTTASVYNSFYIGTSSWSVSEASTLTTYESAGSLAKDIAEGTVDLSALGFNSSWRVVTEDNTTTVYFANNVVDTYTAA